jgi:uncharacterized NAD(P)/FAD-binding protein YdhS
MPSFENGITHGRTPLLRVIIIGGGFSGTLVAIHLLRQSSFVELDIVDQRLPGRGLAYSTNCMEHLLNVPAIRMSAFGSEPLHFLNWLHDHGIPSANPDLFAPRRLYGTYLQDLLETTARSAGPEAKLRHHFSTVQKIGFNGRSRQVFLRNGLRLEADKIVLALGNPSSHSLHAPLPGYFPSPWRPEALSGLSPEKEVLLIGAGLTAVDAFIALVSQGHTGAIHMLSRRGKLPQFHEPYRPLTSSFPVPENLSARSLMKGIRAEVKKARSQSVNWRAVIDSIRPVTNEIWQQLDEKEQTRFFRHIKTWWDIHRHRMASEIGAKVHEAVQRKQLLVHAGRLRKLTPGEFGLRAEIQPRGGVPTSLQVEKVINCTGPDSDYRATEDPLIRCVLDRGYGVPGKTGRGFRATADGEMIGAENRSMDWLLTLGPPRLGDLLETIAVPELRRQAESLANHLLSVDRKAVEIEPEVFLAAGI